MAAYLRSHRQRNGLTLEALADRTGLTKSYLSKVERGLSQPSIAVALKIAQVLNTDVSQLFSDDPDPSLLAVGRAGEQPEPTSAEAEYHVLATGVARKAMQPFLVRPATGVATEDRVHTADEFLFVHAGRVEVTVPGEVITLDAGDSLYLAASTPHRIRSVSVQRARLVVVVGDRDDGERGVRGRGAAELRA